MLPVYPLLYTAVTVSIVPKLNMPDLDVNNSYLVPNC